MKYRTEIDGLRAIAVLPVLFFHAWIPIFQGGFVGVDIFFVISGFLITRIIIDEMQSASGFSIIRFNERQARRILPALFFMLAAAIIIAFSVRLPNQLMELSRNAIGSGLFVSNFTLLLQGGYFGEANEINPLLHVWSLSVEERFFVFFPLVLLLLWKLVGRRGVWVMISLVIVASLGLAEWASATHPTANFYFLPTRVWVLAAGALTGVYLSHRHALTGTIANVTSIVGLGLILASIFMFNDIIPFPSLWGSIPIVGVVLVILSATPGTLVNTVLSQRFLVGIGLISYSAYLWHQPLFAFARVAINPELGWVLTFGLGIFSWRHWAAERIPVRFSRRKES